MADAETTSPQGWSYLARTSSSASSSDNQARESECYMSFPASTEIPAWRPDHPSNPTTEHKSRPASPSSEMSLDIVPPQLMFPREPHPWMWTCDRCGSCYRLSVTNRCLYDGHYYCSGSGADGNHHFREHGVHAPGNASRTIAAGRRRRRRPRRPMPMATTAESGVRSIASTFEILKIRRFYGLHDCFAEFDFIGWFWWGEWRRAVLAARREHHISTDDDNHDNDEAAISTIPRNVQNNAIANKNTLEYPTVIPVNHGLVGCETCDYPGQCRQRRVEQVGHTMLIGS